MSKTIAWLVNKRFRRGNPILIEDYDPANEEPRNYTVELYTPIEVGSVSELQELIGKHEGIRAMIKTRWVCPKTGFKHTRLSPYIHIHINGDEVKVGSIDWKANEHRFFDRVNDFKSFKVLIPVSKSSAQEERPLVKVAVPAVVDIETNRGQLDLFGGIA